MPNRTERTAFAARLLKLRTAAGISQRTLAEAIKTYPQHIDGLEKDKKGIPSWATVCKLADALSVSTDAFRRDMGETPVPPEPPDPWVDLLKQKKLQDIVDTDSTS